MLSKVFGGLFTVFPAASRLSVSRLRLGWYNVKAMIEGFFQLRSPRDMYEKAKREFDRMKSVPNIDTVFNFYVTTYHVKDYVQGEALKAAIDEEFKTDEDFQKCDYICHKGKHLKLTRAKWKKPPFNTFKNRHKPGAVANEMAANEFYANEGESYRLVADGREMDVILLGQQLIEKWERFFKANGI